MNQSNELYVTQTTMDRSTSASVMVNSTGQYMISVFAILECNRNYWLTSGARDVFDAN